MRTLARFTVAAVLVSLFTGCVAPGVSGALPESSASTEAKPAAAPRDATSGRDLLYVTEDRNVLIYSYPQAKREKKIHGYYGEAFIGECADTSGNVYVVHQSPTSYSFIDVYAHGGTKPLHRFVIESSVPNTCSVDPTNGHVAETEYDGVVRTWHSFSGPAKVHHLPPDFGSYACTYDDNGNLFVNGGKLGSRGHLRLLELLKASRKFVEIALPKMLATKTLGGIRWDGTYLAFGAGVNKIYRLAVAGTKARVAGIVNLEQASHVSAIWIQGNTIVGDGYIWNYPAGGKPIGSIPAGDSPGVAVSVPPTH